MFNKKEHNKKYQEDHTEEIKKRKGTYYEENRERLLKYANKYHHDNKEMISAKRYPNKRIKGTIGPPLRAKIKPIKKSPELLAKIEENTRINDKDIKHYKVIKNSGSSPARKILKEVRITKEGG